MPKPNLRAETTAAVTTAVNITTKGRAMLVTRCEEYTTLGREIKDRKERQSRIVKEIDTLFTKEKQGQALVDGTSIDRYRVKLVTGKTKKFDKLGFMKKHGLTNEDFAEFEEEVDKKPYIKVSAAGEKDGDED